MRIGLAGQTIDNVDREEEMYKQLYLDLVARTAISQYSDDVVTIGGSAFIRCNSLESVSFPNCETIGASAFDTCSNLVFISFPKVKECGRSAFNGCQSLINIDFPLLTSLSIDVFWNAIHLKTVNIPSCTAFRSYAFEKCEDLETVYCDNVVTLESSCFSYLYNLKQDVTFYMRNSTYETIIPKLTSNLFSDSQTLAIRNKFHFVGSNGVVEWNGEEWIKNASSVSAGGGRKKYLSFPDINFTWKEAA